MKELKKPEEKKVKISITLSPDLDRTGYDAALWLVGYCRMNNVELPTIKVHSANPEGKKNIERVLHLTNESS